MENRTITLKKDQNVYFTSDLHFLHKNVLDFRNRPFADTKEMGKALIEKWNERVRPDDYIFNLGDTFWFNGRHEVRKHISKMQGRKFFVLGNHCTTKQYELCKDMVTLLPDICKLFINFDKDDERFAGMKSPIKVVLCHYPLACYSGSNKGTYHFFGHIHSLPNEPMSEFDRPIALNSRLCMDVGADRHNYAPVSLMEVIEEIKNYPYWDLHGINTKSE